MKYKEGDPKKLPPYERACARLARIARVDTVYGGARALILLPRFRLKKVPAQEIISEVYGLSNYTCGKWGAYQCPECGEVHLGEGATWDCCYGQWEREDNIDPSDRDSAFRND